jgi:hypothetical protein
METSKWQEIESAVREKFAANNMGLTEWRYCFPCTSFRPPRAHHCSVCNACVTRMDHHCPWVANCVGHNNHKLFWNFLFYSFFGCLMVTFHMGYSAIYVELSAFENNASFIIVLIFSGALVFSLGGLLGVHTYLLVNNLSTLEMEQLKPNNCFSNKRRKLLSTSERKQRLPLQLMFGVRVVPKPTSTRYKMVTDYKKNWTDTMGVSASKWLLPMIATDKTCDGYHWTLYPKVMTV